MTLGVATPLLQSTIFVLYLKAPGTEAGRADRTWEGEGANFAVGCILSAWYGAEPFHSFTLSFVQ